MGEAISTLFNTLLVRTTGRLPDLHKRKEKKIQAEKALLVIPEHVVGLLLTYTLRLLAFSSTHRSPTTEVVQEGNPLWGFLTLEHD